MVVLRLVVVVVTIVGEEIECCSVAGGVADGAVVDVIVSWVD